jgi:peptidyl-Lys metalloendopeptidase
MHKVVRRRFTRWLGIASVSLLGVACGGPEDGAQDEAAVVDGQRELDTRDVTVELALPTQAFAARDDVAVTVTLTNRGAHAVRLLRWFVPGDELQEANFVVTRDGAEVDFIGPHYKRPAPTEADYVRLAPGQSLSRTVSLVGLYDLSRSGTYAVRYEVHRSHFASDAEGALASSAVTAQVEGRAFEVARSPVGEVTAQGISYASNCSDSRRTTLSSAFSYAKSYATNSLNYLNGTPGSKPRYVTWFGAYSYSNWSTARSHFSNIKYGFDNQNIVMDCGCTSGAYAYVYANSPYRIYLCSAFWSAPMTGTDSKAGTLVHEMSHFSVVAGTDDWVYGQSGARNLASTNPARALDNADNHEYFAENTPYQY